MTYAPPIPRRPPPVMITCLSAISTGREIAGRQWTLPSTGAWAEANAAHFFPFIIDYNWTFTAVKGFWHNGATVSATNTIDVGIYDSAGTRLVSMGATTQGATASVLQEVNITDTVLGPGFYYAAMSALNTTGAFLRSFGPTAADGTGMGFKKAVTSHPLPASVTLTTPTTSVMPFFGFSARALVV